MNDDELRAAIDTYAAGAPRTDPRPNFDARLARRARSCRLGVAAGVAVVATAVVALTRPAPERAHLVAVSPMPFAVTRQANGSQGLRMTVRLDYGNPPTATESVLTIGAKDDHGDVMVTEVDWGDGIVLRYEPDDSPLCALPMPPPSRRFPDSLSETKRHAWRNPGAMTVTVTVASGLPCSGRPQDAEEATATFVVEVRAERSTTNGPAAPDPMPLQGHSGHVPRERSITALLTDPDGYVAHAVVDWGDGATESVTNPEPCDDGGGRHYPRTKYSQRLFLNENHFYDTSGTYRITLRYTSTGCGGADPQEQVATLTMPVP